MMRLSSLMRILTLMRNSLLLLPFLLLSACSTFESFSFKLPIELAYGDAAVQADQAEGVARIEADRDVLLRNDEPHTVNVNLPPEMMPAVDVFEVPPALAPGSAGMATMSDGRTLYDCVEGKGGQVICFEEPGQ